MTQRQAFDILKSGRSAFLTGPAGSGKTFLLRLFIKWLKEQGKKVAVTATTGLAATHLGGRTIHSWAGIGIHDTLTEDILRKILARKQTVKDIEETDALIIDEISMLHDFRLNMVDQVCRRIRRRPDLPFGGLQVVLSGDFFQLPPISRNGEEAARFVVVSEAWDSLQPAVCYLDEQYRQDSGSELAEILNAMRNNRLTQAHVDKLGSRRLENPGGLTELHCHNEDIDRINQAKLDGLPGKERVFLGEKTSLSKDKQLLENLVKNCLAPEILRLKQGALVMFVKNNPDGSYINGTLGKVIAFNSATGLPLVETKSGRTIKADREKWGLEREGAEIAAFRQLALRLAWAITIHKSQGMTLDGAFIDLSKTFEPGMGYVALSRLKNLESLYLKGFNDLSLRMNPDALVIDEMLRRQSADTAGP